MIVLLDFRGPFSWLLVYSSFALFNYLYPNPIYYEKSRVNIPLPLPGLFPKWFYFGRTRMYGTPRYQLLPRQKSGILVKSQHGLTWL